MAKKEKIKLDPNNFRIHGDKNKRLIRKSLKENGAGRSILVDKNNVVIAGNGVFAQAQELGLPVRVVESNGKELVVIKRTDLDTEDAKRKALALADNITSDTSIFDQDLILENFTADELDAWEFQYTGEINNVDEEYTGMPEFNQNDESGIKIIFHFKDKKHLLEFAKLIGQKITEKTKTVWIPQQQDLSMKEKIYK